MKKKVSRETGKLDAVSTLTGDDLCMTKEQHKEDDEHKLKNEEEDKDSMEKPCLNDIGMLDGDNESNNAADDSTIENVNNETGSRTWLYPNDFPHISQLYGFPEYALCCAPSAALSL